MKVEFTRPGWDDFLHWREADPKVLARIIDLIEATRRDPFKGMGKPEPLVGNLKGTWSCAGSRASTAFSQSWPARATASR